MTLPPLPIGGTGLIWGGDIIKGAGGRHQPPPPPPGLCLKGRGAIGAVPERLQSGHRRCESGWGGGYWRLEMRLGLVLGYGNAFGVKLVQWGRGEGVPPPSSDSLPPSKHESWYEEHVLEDFEATG